MKSHRLWKLTLVTIALLCSMPSQGVCFSNDTASKILDQAQSGDECSILNTFKDLEHHNVTFSQSRQFLNSLIDEINSQYNLSLTISDACRLIRENFHLLQIPYELQQPLLMTIQHIESDLFEMLLILPEKSFGHLDSKLDLFGYGIYWPWKWNWFGLNKTHHKMKSDPPMIASSPKVELELPPKMAAGFVCALGGALLCVIPGGQGIGLTLMGTGLGLALDGIANGERPYYVDSISGQRVP